VTCRKALCCAALALTVLVSNAPASAAEKAKSGGWLFEADVHLWFPEVGITTAGGDKVKIGISDILRNLDFAFMGGLGARKDKFSFGADVLNMKLEGDGGGQFTVPVGPANRGSLPVSVGAKSVMKSWIVNAIAGYRFLENEDSWLDGIAGMRYLWLDVTNTLDVNLRRLSRSVQVSGSDGFVDGVVGVRGEVKLNPGNNWYFA
jgi:hypothetical protein